MVCLEVVASDDRLVLGGLSFTTNTPAIAHYFTQEVHIPGFKLNSTAQIHERIIRVIYLGIDIANAPQCLPGLFELITPELDIGDPAQFSTPSFHPPTLHL